MMIAVFAFSGLLLAQGPGFRPGPGFGLGVNAPAGVPPAPAALKDFLGLTDAQVTQLIEIRKSLPDVMKPFFEELRAKQTALREEMQKTNPDSAKVGALMVEMKAIREKARAAREKLDDQAKAVLTPDQKTKLAQLEAAQKLLPAIRQGVAFGLLDGPAGDGARRGAGAGLGFQARPGAPAAGMGLMGGRAARPWRGPIL
jgi:hypothetical protein